MNFNYTQGIPNGPDNPSDDQPNMQTNTNSDFGIWNVDHYGFVNALGGWHKVIRLPEIVGNTDPLAVNVVPNGFPANAGQIYTKTVNGDLYLYYESSNGVVNQLTNDSSILDRAAVNFTQLAGVVTINNSYNVSSVTRISAGVYVIAFTNNISSAFYYTAISGFSNGTQVYGSITALPTISQLRITFVNSSGSISDVNQASITVSL
jgi:hypothetical protein